MLTTKTYKQSQQKTLSKADTLNLRLFLFSRLLTWRWS